MGVELHPAQAGYVEGFLIASYGMIGRILHPAHAGYVEGLRGAAAAEGASVASRTRGLR